MKSNALVFGRRPEFELASVSHGRSVRSPREDCPLRTHPAHGGIMVSPREGRAHRKRTVALRIL